MVIKINRAYRHLDLGRINDPWSRRSCWHMRLTTVTCGNVLNRFADVDRDHVGHRIGLIGDFWGFLVDALLFAADATAPTWHGAGEF